MKLLLLIAILIIITNAFISVDETSRHFKDNEGRIRIFHGVNIVYKIHPYLPDMEHWSPQYSVTEDDIEDLYRWGFNFVRLGVMWPGVEVTRGVYNQSYFDQVNKLVNMFANKGIYVLVDCHQDLLSRKFCGEGVPDYAADDSKSYFPFPLPALFNTFPDDKDGYPNITYCLEHQFGRFYLSGSVNAAFQALYDNKNGIQDAFVEYWKKVANNFVSNNYIVGYELINEPWPGDIFRHPSFLYNGPSADLLNLAPMYENLQAAIREIDPDHIIFYEPSLTDLAHVDSGFKQVPGGPEYNNRSIYSFHIYCGPNNRTGDPSNEFLCDLENIWWFENAISNFKRIGGGGMLTEWGNMPDNPIDMDNIRFMTESCDRFQLSWTWWQFKSFHDITTAGIGTSESFYDEEGNLQTAKVKALSRTYAYAIAGDLISMEFNQDTAEFKLSYRSKNTISDPTEIYLNTEWYYPNDYKVTLNTTLAQWKKIDTNRISITVFPNVPTNTLINVDILPSQ